MTTSILSTAGGNLGSMLGPIGRFVGSEIGTYFGARLDSMFFGLDKTSYAYKGHLNNLNIQTSTYGQIIPIIYGTAKIAGNIIWALPIKEVLENKQTTSGKWGPHTTKVSMRYSYYATLAIAICTGIVHELINIYANMQPLDRKNLKYRFYQGTENQEPDYLINEIEEMCPAYRGLSYIVIEDFPLADYGNRIPNFTFEVLSNTNPTVTQKIKGINIIPGSGEFVYDTRIQTKSQGQIIDSNWVQTGLANTINQNTTQNLADALMSLDNMQQQLPNLEWVSVVVNWFSDSLDIGKCNIYPAVEYQNGAKSFPEEWEVAGITRKNARLISQDTAGNILYGGTICDNALVRYLQELKSHNYKILFYPMLLVDIEGKPWRGNMTGNAEDITTFFTQYNAFIEHYANLVKDRANAFIIGSEFKGITQINEDSSYPGVKAFAQLAGKIKNIIGTDTIITYAADWSEYHSNNNVYYMDELWSSNNIDVVGIDAYFPLTDKIQPDLGFSIDDIKNGWNSGEGYDYYYKNYEERTGKTYFDDPTWAWKNINEWWSKEHFNPDHTKTAWEPKMKKVWFTEYGFPSVDCCSNQPNVFVDNSSIDSKLPFYSKGNVDFRAQSISVEGTIEKWLGSDMVENMFLWAWDARPFPYFPNLIDIWADGKSWSTGHWIQGKLSLPKVSDIISDIMQKGGYHKDEFVCEKLDYLVEGVVINEGHSTQSAMELLQQVFFFDIVIDENKLIFKPMINNTSVEIKQEELIPIHNNSFMIEKSDSTLIPTRIEIEYISKARNYEISTVYSERPYESKQRIKTLSLPIVLSDYHAKSICNKLLYYIWQSTTNYSLNLSPNYITVMPSDVIKINIGEVDHAIKITNISYGNILKVNGISHDSSIYNNGSDQFYTPAPSLQKDFPSITEFRILDLPTNAVGINIVKNGTQKGWKGAALYISNNENENYEQIANLYGNTIQGKCLTALPNGPISIIDEGSETTVLMQHGQLESISQDSFLNGVNLALIGQEIIQFKNAELIRDNEYKLSGFLRGRYSTEEHTANHEIGEDFILIDDLAQSIAIDNNEIGKTKLYKAISYGEIGGNTLPFTYHNNYLKPFSVVHTTILSDIDGNITISWIRRSRIDSDLRDYIDVPLAEEFEKYDIEIYKDNSVIRTLNTNNINCVQYSATDQINDFGNIQTELNLAIYQLSAIVGRGYGSVQNIRVNKT